MRIDRLQIENFKKFERQDFDFHPQFTLLVGDNGSGKTSVLDALAVAMSVWLVDVPDTTLKSSRRKIEEKEIRLEATLKGDRIQFNQYLPVAVKAIGQIGGNSVEWRREILKNGKATVSRAARGARKIVAELYRRDGLGERIIFPVLASYGAGRAWLPSNERVPAEPKTNGAARRWAAFYGCFDERIRFAELQKWFLGETLAAVNRGGRMRPGFEVVKRAILRCMPQADGLWYDVSDRHQVILSIAGKAQPFDNLSAGQRMMLALVADLAIKAVTQNAYLLPPDQLGSEDEPLPRVLRKTPGVVLIDELDVHLHPKWQRRVASDLKETFPSIQFVCTSHSPQVIGEVSRDEVRLLTPEGIKRPSVALGADSNWILDHIMEGAVSETKPARTLQDKVEDALAEGDLKLAGEKLRELRQLLDGDTGELVRLESSLQSLEEIAKESRDGT